MNLNDFTEMTEFYVSYQVNQSFRATACFFLLKKNGSIVKITIMYYITIITMLYYQV